VIEKNNITKVVGVVLKRKLQMWT